MIGPYDDIIGLPHHVSAVRPQMPRENRAAQFSPFAALTGYDDAIGETARLTDERIELGESSVAELDLKLGRLAETIESRPYVSVTHFRPDTKKAGGAYITTTGNIKRIDGYERAVILTGGEKIYISDILTIDSDLFKDLI